MTILLFCWMTILLEVTTNNQTTKQPNNQTTKHHYCTKKENNAMDLYNFVVFIAECQVLLLYLQSGI